MDQKKTIQLHQQWWKRENQEILVANYFPIRFPDLGKKGLDIDIPVKDIGWRKKASAQARHEAADRYGSDVLIVEQINFSTGMVPAIAGAGFEYDQGTSWSHPIAERISDVHINRFTPHHPLWVEYERRLEELLKHWSWDSYLPGMAPYLGPMDILAGFLGPTNLCLALMDEPTEVHKRAMDAAEFLIEMMDHETSLHRSAGMTEGLTDVFAIWLAGAGLRATEDFATLIGPEQFHEFCIEPLSRVYRSRTSVFQHYHSLGLKNLPELLKVENLGGVQIGNDPNGPDIDQLIAGGRLVQQAGKCLQIGSYNVDLTPAVMERITTSLDARGLLLRFNVRSECEARDLHQMVKAWSRTSAS